MDLSYIFGLLISIHLIGYELDIKWIHFWIIQNKFWVGFWLGSGIGSTKSILTHVEQTQAESIQAKLELGRPKQKSSRVNPEKSRSRVTLVQVELSGPEPKSIRHLYKVEPAPDPCHAKSTRVDVEPSHSQPMSIWVSPCSCWAKSTSTDVEPSWPEFMSSWVDVEPS